MIFKYNEAKERNVGNNMKIKDLYSGKNMPIDFVIGKLNGFHGTFKNTKSIMCMPSFDSDKEQII